MRRVKISILGDVERISYCNSEGLYDLKDMGLCWI